jgi:hypothetical protein
MEREQENNEFEDKFETRSTITAIILFAVGKGAASGKYAIIASLGNLPVVYMTALNGWAHDHWNASGMLYFEAIIAIPTIALGVLGLHLIRAKTMIRN